MERYIYRAKLAKVVDGDTIDADVDLGFQLTARLRLRLLGLNAAEMHASDPAERQLALEAKCWLKDQLEVHGPFVIKTAKADAFGRYLADIYCGEFHLNQVMIDCGLAVPFMRAKNG
jgi:micrococcal nuclease